MRVLLSALVALPALLGAPASAQDDTAIRVELNALESLQDRCRLLFVVENKSSAAIETLKLELAVFNAEQIVQRRFVVELAPIRAAKTMVKAVEIEGACAQVGSILVNDVTACAPGDAGACLDRLALSSRAKDIRLYK